MADTIDYRVMTIQKIQEYLDQVITGRDASAWALDVMVKTKHLEGLSVDVLSAIQCLCDLHDEGETWCPSQEELETWKTKLQKTSA